MRHGIISFGSVGIALLSLSLFYLLRKLLTVLNTSPRAKWLTIAFLFLLFVVAAGSRTFWAWLRWSGYLSTGLIAQWLFYGLVDDIAFYCSALFNRLTKLPRLYPISARKPIFFSILAISLIISSVGLWKSSQVPEIKKFSIDIPGLPQMFSGLRIVQLSDVHIGPTLRGPWLQRVVEAANKLHPDLIVLTGDLVEGHGSDTTSELVPFSQLSAPLGVYTVLGNHERHSEAINWATQYRGLGLTVLENDSRRIYRDSQSIVLTGLSDSHNRTSRTPSAQDLSKALAGISANETTILLSHQPDAFAFSGDYGVKLQLSGHTHGGQFFPFSLFARLVHKYFLGLYQKGQSVLYVHPGTGYWGPPLRIGVPAEITEITLLRKPI